MRATPEHIENDYCILDGGRALALSASSARCGESLHFAPLSTATQSIGAGHNSMFARLTLAQSMHHFGQTPPGQLAPTLSVDNVSVRLVKARLAPVAPPRFEGSDTTLLGRLEQSMTSASIEIQFERAMTLRDTWQSLAWLDRQLQRLRQVRAGYSFVYAQPRFDGRELWYLIRHGELVAVTAPPVGRRAAGRTLALLEATYGKPRAGTSAPDRLPPDMELLLLVASWFRQFPEELERTIPLARARRLCHSRRRGACPVAG